MSYSLKEMPAGMPSPVNPVIIQARINPQKTYSDPLLSDYVAPPFSLVFSNITKEPTPSVASQIMSLKRKRDNDVLDVFTNAYNINTRAKPGSQLKCIGVAYEGIMDGKSVKKTPDARGRIGVMVHGCTSIICNPDDLKTLTIGDEIAWTMRDNKLMLTGCPMDWSTVKLTKYIPPLGMLETDVRFDTLFGSKVKYVGTRDQEEELKNRLIFLNDRQGGGLPSFFGIDGIDTKSLVEAIAIVLFKKLDITYTNWEDVLYDVKSKYYIMAAKPTTDTDIKWITDCFGELPGNIYAKKDTDDKITIVEDAGSDVYFLPQSNGWLNEFLRASKKEDIYSDYKSGRKFDGINPDLTSVLAPQELYDTIMGPVPTDSIKKKENSEQFITLLASNTRRRLNQLYFVAGDYLKRNTVFKRANIDKEQLDMYMHLCKTQFDFNDLTQSQAKDLVDDILNKKITKTPGPYTQWLSLKRKLIISQTQKHENKIGTLVAKSDGYATILLSTN